MRKTVSFLLAFVLASACFCCGAYADGMQPTSECVSGLEAVYYADGDSGKLVITADISGIGEKEYVIIQVYANVTDINNPSNGTMNSFVTMKMLMASKIENGRINYTIDYESRKLPNKCAVCLQIPNRGENNDWVRCFMTAPFICKNSRTPEETSTVNIPVGFGLESWTRDNAAFMPSFERDGFEITGWSDTKTGTGISADAKSTLNGGVLYAVWGKKETKGDLDSDGNVTVSDALAALRISVGLDAPGPAAVKKADADGNGRITVADAMLILRCAAKLITL